MKQIVKVCYPSIHPAQSESAKLVMKKLRTSVWPLSNCLRGSSSHNRMGSVITGDITLVPRTKVQEKRSTWRIKTESSKRAATRWQEEHFESRVPKSIPSKIDMRQFRKVPSNGFRTEMSVFTLYPFDLLFHFVVLLLFGRHVFLATNRFLNRSQAVRLFLNCKSFSVEPAFRVRIILKNQMSSSKKQGTLTIPFCLNMDTIVKMFLDDTGSCRR
mmetsp:Transcript_26586/g.48083  ORF Transcript_26586/g.48083 Transcript_26586/m.48083 type:complete len:215 (-) Transcript_26586:3339-3983(-)